MFDEDGFPKIRINLIVISIILILTQFFKFHGSNVSFYGIEIEIDPFVFSILINTVFVYFLYRYLVAFNEVQDKRLNDFISGHVERFRVKEIKEKFRLSLADHYPNIADIKYKEISRMKTSNEGGFHEYRIESVVSWKNEKIDEKII